MCVARSARVLRWRQQGGREQAMHRQRLQQAAQPDRRRQGVGCSSRRSGGQEQGGAAGRSSRQRQMAWCWQTTQGLRHGQQLAAIGQTEAAAARRRSTGGVHGSGGGGCSSRGGLLVMLQLCQGATKTPSHCTGRAAGLNEVQRGTGASPFQRPHITLLVHAVCCPIGTALTTRSPRPTSC